MINEDNLEDTMTNTDERIQRKSSKKEYIKATFKILGSAIIVYVLLLVLQTYNSNGFTELYKAATSKEALSSMANILIEEQLREEQQKNSKSKDDYIDMSIDNSEQKDHTEKSTIIKDTPYKLSYFNNAIVDGTKVKNEYKKLSSGNYACLFITKDMIENYEDITKCKNIQFDNAQKINLNDFTYKEANYQLAGLNYLLALEDDTLQFRNNYFVTDSGHVTSNPDDTIHLLSEELDNVESGLYINDDKYYLSYLIKGKDNKILGVVFIEDIF